MLRHIAGLLRLEIQALHADRPDHADVVDNARRDPHAPLRRHHPCARRCRQDNHAGGTRDQLAAPVVMRRDHVAIGILVAHGDHGPRQMRRCLQLGSGGPWPTREENRPSLRWRALRRGISFSTSARFQQGRHMQRRTVSLSEAAIGRPKSRRAPRSRSSARSASATCSTT